MTIALIVVFLAAQSAVGDDGLWFCADFDSPPELEGMRLDQDMRVGVVVDGNGWGQTPRNMRFTGLSAISTR